MSTAQRFAWLDGLAAVTVCAAAATVLPAPDTPTSPWGLAARAGLMALVCVLAFYYNDLYNFEAPHDVGQLFRRLCRAVGVTALVLAFGYLLFPGLLLGGSLTSYALLLTLVSVLLVRVTVYALAKRPPFSERVLILGGGPLAAELASHIRTRPDLALRLVGVLAPGPEPGPAWLGGYGDVADVVRRYRPDRIVVAMPDRRGNLPVSELLACRFRGITVEEGTRVFERLTGRLAVESLTPSALIFGDGFRVRRLPRLLMRALSLAVALIALVLTAPLIAAIAVAVRLESPGPAFFIQDRVGLGGRRFRLVKFRTMREATPGAGDSVWGRDNASRVTRLGAVLRRYRLDELPQCLNILRGDMNLVGPRPEMATNVATFSAVIPYYNFRHEVRPGLTGWAQVKAGYSMSTEEVTRKLCYDLYYIKHMSPAFDLQILIDTVKFVLSGTRPG